jgi:hypothetical protein
MIATKTRVAELAEESVRVLDRAARVFRLVPLIDGRRVLGAR